MRLDYALKMAECEGLINTREGKLNRVIAEVRSYADSTMPEAAFRQSLERNGINPASLTNAEFQRILNAIKG